MFNIIKEATPSNKNVLDIIKRLDDTHTNIIDDNGVACDLKSVIQSYGIDKLKSETGVFYVSNIIPNFDASRVSAKISSNEFSDRVTIQLSENEIMKIHNIRRPSFSTGLIVSEPPKGKTCYTFEDENFLKNYITQIIKTLLKCGLISKDDFL
tara:strand:- start:234767 stop:235225 length:459 start_codon:yes stop_codon:yes gene_type:complete